MIIQIINNVMYHKPYGLGITAVIELHICIVYISINTIVLLHRWFLLCTMCDVDITNPERILYPVKTLIRNPAYLFKINNI